MPSACAASPIDRHFARHVLFVLCCGAAARAEPAPVLELGAPGCEAFDLQEVERILRIELASEAVVARVALRCDAASVEVDVRDAGSGKRLTRRLPSPSPDEPGAERVLAIAASQVVRALEWLPEAEPEGKAPPAPVPTAPTPARSEPAPAPHSTTPEPVRPAHSAGVVAGVRVRDIEPRFVTARLGLYGGLPISRDLSLLIVSALEGGSTERRAGSVSYRSASGGVGLAYRAWRGPRAAIDWGLSLSGGYLRLAGEATPGFEGFAVEGYAAELGVSVRPTLSLPPLELGLGIEVGGTLPSVDALVEGDERVSLRGPWGGASAALALAF
jgi:hypothetical protein